MAIVAKPLGRFDVSGSATLGYRFKTVVGSTRDDTLTLNKMYLGAYGALNLGAGTDSVSVGVAGDWRLLLKGVETITAAQAATTLSLISDASFETNGSFTQITGGYGIQSITFTGAVRDNTVSLGDLSDKVTFSSTSADWLYNKSGSTVYAYDYATGYNVAVNSDVETLNLAGSDITSSSVTASKLYLTESGTYDISNLSLQGAPTGIVLATGGNSVTLSSGNGITAFTGSSGTDSITVNVSSASYVVGSGTDVETYAVNWTDTAAAQTLDLRNLTTAVTLSLVNADVNDSGPDTLYGGQGNDTIVGGENMEIWSGSVYMTLDGHSGTADEIQFAGDWTAPFDDSIQNIEIVTLTASADVDLTTQTESLDIRGSTSADTITAGEGDDTIDAGAGDDSIAGGLGADTLNAGAGDNEITDAGVGADEITHDTSGATVAVTVTDIDTVTLLASEAGATVTVASGVDGDVDASGSSAAVELSGDDGDDTLTGGDGDDTITGGAGADNLTGGAGVDTFVYATGTDGTDTITDFTTTEDIYSTDFATTLGTGASAAVTSAAVDTTAALVVDTTASDVVQVTGVTLTAANSTSEAAVIAAISNGTITVTALDTFLLSVVTATNTYLYEVTEAGGVATTITAADDDIVLVGVFSNGVEFATGDITAA